MAIRIPRIESQMQPPSSTGQRMIPNVNEPVARAIQGIGQDLGALAQERTRKRNETDLMEAERELRNQSMEMFLSDSENKRGKLALGDKDKGEDAVFDAYDKFSSEKVAGYADRFSGSYKDAALGRLNAIADSYREKYAIYQAQQESTYRKETMLGEIDSISNQLYLDVKAGDGVDRAIAVAGEIEDKITRNSKGGPVAEVVAQTRANLFRQAVLAKSDADPHAARELLADERIASALDPDQVAALNKTLDQKAIDFDAKVELARINQVPADYATKLKAAQGIEDPEVKQKVVAQLAWEDGVQQKIKTESQYGIISGAYDAIFVKGNPPSPADVDQNQTLDPNQKLMIKSWLQADGAKKEGQFGDVERLERWAEVRGRIIGQGLNPHQVMQEAMKGGFDIRDAKELVKFAEDVRAEPRMKAGDDLLQERYPLVWKNDKKRNAGLRAVQEGIYDYMRLHQTFPDYKQLGDIVDFAATKTGGTEFLGVTFGEKAPLDFASSEAPRYSDKIMADIRKVYPKAVLDAESGNVQLEAWQEGGKQRVRVRRPDGSIVVLGEE